MDIYFSGSIRGGREDAKLYSRIIRELKKYGDVLTEHVGSDDIGNTLSDREIHDRDVQWLEKANIVIAEVTTPSLGVGYEIGRAVALNKKTHCFYRELPGKEVSAMIKGSPDLNCSHYTDIQSFRNKLRTIFE
jgi:nucleoside 2-deoxyribosyltransferase